MQSSHLVSSSNTRLEINELSPKRKRSGNKDVVSVFSNDFFLEMKSPTVTSLTPPKISPNITPIVSPIVSPTISPTISPSISPLISPRERKCESPISNRPRSNDIVDAERPLITIQDSPVDDNIDLIPERKSQPRLSTISKLRASITSLMPSQPKEEKVHLSPRSPRISNCDKSIHINALKKIGLPNNAPDANRLVSFELGKAILQPQNIENFSTKITGYIAEGISNASLCGEEMWRSIGSTKLFNYTCEKPLIDGTAFKEDKEFSHAMGQLLNHLFNHINQTSETLISHTEFGSSQSDAGKLSSSLLSRLQGMDESIITTMQRMLGLGKQELYTHPASWTIPEKFHTVLGKEELVVTEFGPTVGEKMKPLQYDREISIILLENGGLDYIVEQPITFKLRETNDLLGTCRMQTTLHFDNKMNFLSGSQEVKAASILYDL